MTVSNFTAPIPEELRKDPSTVEYFRQLGLFLDNISRPEGVLATADLTAEVTLTQQEKLDLLTVTQGVNLDDMESKINLIATGLPNYSVSNDGTLRTLNADAATGAITAPAVLQAEGELLRDAILELADFVSTMYRDLKAKGIFS